MKQLLILLLGLLLSSQTVTKASEFYNQHKDPHKKEGSIEEPIFYLDENGVTI